MWSVYVSIIVVLQAYLEILGLFSMALVIAGITPSLRQVMGYSAGLMLAIQSIRYLPFPFGIHTLLGLLFLMIIVIKIGNVSSAKGFLAAFSSAVLIAVLEFGFHTLAFALLEVDVQTVATDPLLWALVGLPQAVTMIILALTVWHFRARKGTTEHHGLSSPQQKSRSFLGL